MIQVQNILMRFGLNHQLNFALPSAGNYIGRFSLCSSSLYFDDQTFIALLYFYNVMCLKVKTMQSLHCFDFQRYDQFLFTLSWLSSGTCRSIEQCCQGQNGSPRGCLIISLLFTQFGIENRSSCLCHDFLHIWMLFSLKIASITRIRLNLQPHHFCQACKRWLPGGGNSSARDKLHHHREGPNRPLWITLELCRHQWFPSTAPVWFAIIKTPFSQACLPTIIGTSSPLPWLPRKVSKSLWFKYYFLPFHLDIRRTSYLPFFWASPHY